MRRYEPSLLLTLLAVGLSSGCRVAPPPVRAEASYGVVRATTVEEAERIAGWLDEYYPRVRALLPDTRDRPIEVWAQPELGLWSFQELPETMTGFVDEGSGRIHVLSTGRCVEQTLCHELVHALLGESWRSLPVVVEEGLCEHVSFRLVGGCSRAERTNMLLATALYLHETAGVDELEAQVTLVFRGPVGEVYSQNIVAKYLPEFRGSMPPVVALRTARNSVSLWSGETRINPYHYGLGTWIVDRIVERSGIDGLHDLCTEALGRDESLVSAESYLAAAELGSRSTWIREVLDGMENEDLRRLAAPGLEGILDRAAGWVRQLAPEVSSDPGIIDRVDILFRFEDGGPFTSLLADDHIRAGLSQRLTIHLADARR